MSDPGATCWYECEKCGEAVDPSHVRQWPREGLSHYVEVAGGPPEKPRFARCGPVFVKSG